MTASGLAIQETGPGTTALTQRLVLTEAERGQVEDLLNAVCARFQVCDDLAFLQEAALYAHELPRRIRTFLVGFKLIEGPSGVCVISGLEIDQVRVGRTPLQRTPKGQRTSSFREEALLILLGCLLGDPFGWSTHYDGRIVHDIFPIEAHRDEQLSCGSEQTLQWHVEDAFHSYRADYLGLMCVRNPDRVGTTVATINSALLDPACIDVLFQPRFSIRPDESHAIVNNPFGEKAESPAFRRIREMAVRPGRVAVLYGGRSSPYCRIDPLFMDPADHDPEAVRALNALIRTFDDALLDIVLAPGDTLFLDNYRVVHGRRPFYARYDGNDRWLKRLCLTRDLRKSRDMRADCRSRVLL